MAKPGPKPGFKKAPPFEQPPQAVVEGVEPSPIPVSEPVLSAQDRENPDKLTGDALRALANRRGMSRTEAARMTDAKIREQLRYIAHRQYESSDALG